MKISRKQAEFGMSIILLIFVYIVTSQLPAAEAGSSKVQSKNKVYTVMLDAGHGGVDPGKISVTGTNEKEINLAIALKVKKKLKKKGYKVVMSRETDEGLYEEGDRNKKTADLKKRCQMAEASHCDILISIHQNSYSSEEVRGAQMFYYSGSEEGKKLAELLQEQFLQEVDEQNTRTVKQNDDYYILRNVSCPAVIAECGFLSNYEEAALLETENYQEKIADAITQGIEAYFKTGSD